MYVCLSLKLIKPSIRCN